MPSPTFNRRNEHAPDLARGARLLALAVGTASAEDAESPDFASWSKFKKP